MTIFNSNKAAEPVGAYPHSRRFGNLLFLSGIGPRKKGEKEIPGVVKHDIKVQTESVIDNIRYVLEESGLGLEHIIDIQVFLTNMDRDFKEFNEAYASTFKDLRPTRTTVQVTSLPTPISVEFKVIAGFPDEKEVSEFY